jgi:spore coat polysaccharide biosynthesis protein SpsF
MGNSMTEIVAPRVVAIIQARMGSKRFPGKMLADLAGEPLLFHIVARAQRLESVQEIVLATTPDAQDEGLVGLAESMGVTVIRGPEYNVLQRFLMVLNATRADIVIRICGDAPLFDPTLLDWSVSVLEEHNADLILLRDDVRIAQQGASVISARALRWTGEVAEHDPLAYEHVTAYATTHHQRLRTVIVDPDPELVGEYHLSIDTMADLQFMRWIYQKLYVPGQIVSLRDVVQLLRTQNAPVKQL